MAPPLDKVKRRERKKDEKLTEYFFFSCDKTQKHQWHFHSHRQYHLMKAQHQTMIIFHTQKKTKNIFYSIKKISISKKRFSDKFLL